MPPITAFASHDWGEDHLNHAKVAIVVRMLRSKGIEVWFDEDHMKGNILDAMCKGIDDCDVVIVFVTCNYMIKVEKGDESDNVRREFMYAKEQHHKLIPVCFDAALPKSWTGPVGMMLGSLVFVNLVLIEPAGIETLARAIRRKTGNSIARPVIDPSFERRSPPPLPANRISNCAKVDVPLKARLAKVLAAFDETALEQEHTYEAIDRLLRSIAPRIVRSGLPLHQRLAILERELGIDYK